MDGTIIQQGTFTQPAIATDKILEIRSDVDWIRVLNLTQADAANMNSGYEFYWQRGMPLATPGVVYYHPAADQTCAVNALTAATGFTLVDSSLQTISAGVAYTAVSGATPPVVSAATAILNNGNVVRMINGVGSQQLSGMDFTIGNINPGVTFELSYGPTIVAAAASGANAVYRRIYYDPVYYPPYRFITNITRAVQAVVTLSVTHGYTVGEVVGFRVPASYGMVEMNNLRGTVTAINLVTNTITVDIDSSAFTAFAFPLTGAQPFSHAVVVPVGEMNNLILSTATRNTTYIGIALPMGALAPAGVANDVIFWVAGKSENV